MLKAITSAAKVKKLNARLFERLREYDSITLSKQIVYPQGSWDCNVFYSKVLRLWWYSDITGRKYKERYWNVFGIENPCEKHRLNIACEINMPLKGFNFRTAGIWAEGPGKRTYLLHSGKIGGGSKGVGKNLFLDNYRGGQYEDVVFDNGTIKRYATVIELESDNLGAQINWFVKEINRIKTIARKLNRQNVEDSEKHYRPEFKGSKKYKLPDEITADCNHGIVVEELRLAIEALNIPAYNSQQVDLYSTKGKVIQNIFEIKTVVSRQTIYTAVGQLLVNSIAEEGYPKKYFVCPADIKDNLVDDLKKLDISVIKYNWKNEKLHFVNLSDFFGANK